MVVHFVDGPTRNATRPPVPTEATAPAPAAGLRHRRVPAAVRTTSRPEGWERRHPVFYVEADDVVTATRLAYELLNSFSPHTHWSVTVTAATEGIVR